MSGLFNADLSIERHVTGGGIWQEGVWDGVGGETELYLTLPHCRHQNDSCVKMGSDESETRQPATSTFENSCGCTALDMPA